MAIKIEKLLVFKDVKIPEFIEGGFRPVHTKLTGNINVIISEGKISGSSEVPIDTVSEGLQDELHKVLNKIEDELNGVGTDDGDSPKVETINITLNVSNLSGDSKDIEGFSKKIADSLKRSQGVR